MTFDLSLLVPTDRYTADVVYQTTGGQAWTHVPVAPGGRAHFCFDLPAEDLAQLYLVIANQATAPSAAVGGSIRVRPVGVPCGTWAVHARYTEYVGAQVSMSITVMGEIALSRDPWYDPTPAELTYILEFGAVESSGDAGTASFAAPIAQVGGAIAAAADTGGPSRREVRPDFPPALHGDHGPEHPRPRPKGTTQGRPPG